MRLMTIKTVNRITAQITTITTINQTLGPEGVGGAAVVLAGVVVTAGGAAVVVTAGGVEVGTGG